MKPPVLSFVVIGRNEGARLERCLASIVALDLPVETSELIYVDSASLDQSVAVAQRLGANVVMQDWARPTAAAARNAGAARAAGEFLFFLDGDTLLEPAFLASALAKFNDPTIAVVWGQRRELYPRSSIFNTVVDLDWMFPPPESKFCGGDALIRSAAFKQAGGYDSSLIAGEEPDLCQRLVDLGWRLHHAPIPMTLHDIDMHSVSQYWRRAERTGYAYAQVSKRFQDSPRPLWKAESRRNQTRVLALLGGLVLACGASLFMASSIPCLLALALFAALAFRTSLRNRWKTTDFRALLLYGIHSHLQQIPIYFGQLKYRADARLSQSRSLIEYKTMP